MLLKNLHKIFTKHFKYRCGFENIVELVLIINSASKSRIRAYRKHKQNFERYLFEMHITLTKQ